MRFFLFITVFFLSASHSLFATTTSDVFAKYRNRCFVETGSYLGDGIQNALNAGFEQVYSIELSEKYYRVCQNRFYNNQKVELVLGDSAKVLSMLLAQISEPVTFWLDGHCSQGDTAKGATMTPLLQELEAIKNHAIKAHTILIDDIRCFGTSDFDEIVLIDVIRKLKEINPRYLFAFEKGHQENDVLVAFIQECFYSITD